MPDRRIKIAFVIGQLNIGGTERHLLSLVSSLNRKKFNPSVISLSEDSALTEDFHKVGCEVFSLDRYTQGRIRALLKLIKLLKENQPDIIHVFSYASRAGILAGKISRVSKLIVSFRTDPFRWMTPIDRILIHNTDAVIENSFASLSRYKVNNQNSSQKTFVIHNGIDLHDFDRKLCAVTTRRNEGISDHSGKILIAVATLRPVKYLQHLLQAFSVILQKVPSAKLWMIGDGGERQKLENLSRDLGIFNCVQFWGMQTNVPSILRKGKIGILSSKHEGLSNAIIEYMAAGLPVVATDVGGNSELVVNGETGYLIPFNDIEAMANAIVRLLQDESLAERLGKAGRERIEENFTLEKMVHQSEQLYQALLNGNVQ